MRILAFSFLILTCAMPASAEENPLPCGQVAEGHKGNIPEWPLEPVDFKCELGFSRLSLCILNRTGIQWLSNAGPDFVAINDNNAIYALTRESHEAYPMIVRREVVKKGGSVSVETSACGYGDKAASDRLIAGYEKLDQEIIDRLELQWTERDEK